LQQWPFFCGYESHQSVFCALGNKAVLPDHHRFPNREIAELAGKEHRDVMRDIRTMLVELHGEGGVLSFEHTHVDPQNGQSYPIFNLPKRETLILVSGYSVAMRAKIIDRWQELEDQARNPIAALSRVDLLKLALDSEEKRLQLESKVVELAPKAEALDRLTLADGSFCIRDAAKTLQVAEKVLKQKLIECRWMYRRPMGTGYLAYSDKLQQGLCEHKITQGDRGDGSQWVNTQARITAKGMARLAQDLSTGPMQ
jgi:Rha family phage regulatory protein